MKKKLFTCAFAFLAAASVCALGCGDQTKKESETKDTVSLTETAEAVTESGLDFAYPVFSKDTYFEGEEFRIYYVEWGMYREYFRADEQNGEVLNDTLYNRYAKIKDILGVNIVMEAPDPIGTWEFLPRIQEQVMAGENHYDLFLTHVFEQLAGIAAGGYAYDLNTLPNVKLDQPYWNQNAQEALSVNGHWFFGYGDYMLPDPVVIFFNKQLAANHNLGDLYAMVEKGEWTWDKLIENAQNMYQDLNGDGKMDENDQYGFMGELDWQFSGVLQSIGESIIIKDEQGVPILSPLSEKTIDTVQKMNYLLNEGGFSYVWKYLREFDPNVGNLPPVSFSDGRALFYLVPMNTASVYRETNVDFGILPFPKYDEEQKTYNSLNWSGMMVVPSNADHPDCTGAVLELLNAEGRASVLPCYYDIILNSKISRDDASAKMLDIIFNNTVFDFGMTYKIDWELSYMFANLMKGKNKDIVSYVEKRKAPAEKALAQLLEQIEEHYDS